ncbi:MAG: S9 family peptidase, partial [Acidimicrobiia bacterium]|nr:S9 family peptidase [Acidimicrobiia bacterium]
GTRIAFTISKPDLAEDRYDRVIHLSDSEGTRRFTAGPGDSLPRWSPDGAWLSFARQGDGKRVDLMVMPVAGGEARSVAVFDLGIDAIVWAPDSSKVAVVAVAWEEEWEGLTDKERARRPRLIRSFPYRYDNRGMLFDRRRHIWIADPAGVDEAVCVTPGPHDAEFPDWSPDGRTIAFLSDRDGGLTLGNDAWEVDLTTGETAHVATRGFWSCASYRLDGVLHLLGVGAPVWPANSSLHRVEADGSLTDVTGHLDRSGVSLAAGPAAIRWDGQTAIIGHEDSGTFGLAAIEPDGSMKALVEGRRVVTGFSHANGVLAFTATSRESTGDLHVLSGGNEATLTDLGSSLPLFQPDHFRVESDGVEVDAWVYMPEGDETVPVVLSIHGGPASQYGFGFFDEFQVYAGSGFAVVACNPRGSAGRGLDYLTAVTGDGWGVVDRSDVTRVLEAALARHPRMDAGRVGIMGGSYGGFLTAWMTAKDQRFASAVVERGLLSYPSFAGTSDIGPTFPASYTGADYPDGWAAWWEKSPLAYAHEVTTPTLVLHAENDFRCPIEQAEQYFLALLRNGVEAEFLRFPDEGHEMSRSGKPLHRLERFQAVVEWHKRHLTGAKLSE